MKAFAPQAKDASAGKHQAIAKRNLLVPVFPVPALHGDGVLLQRKASCACGGSCPSCAQKSHRETMQTKLQVSSPGDQYEQEADRVADQVMRMPDPMVQRMCTSCAEGSETPNEEEAPVIKRQTNGEGDGIREVPSDFTSRLGTGMPLDSASRRFFEPRFGHSFGAVRIHDDARADASARSVRALAYTVGSHVVFRSGTFSPGSGDGRRLLAHELAHVVQQSGVAPRRSLTLAVPRVARQTETEEAEPATETATETEEGGGDGGTPAAPTAAEIGSQADGQTPGPGGRGGEVVYSSASSPDEDPEVAQSREAIPSNTVTCVKKWQPCRAPYRPGTWAARMTYHCPRLILPWGIILPGTTMPAFATIPDEFIGTHPVTGRDRYRCRPGSSVRTRSIIADAAAFAFTRTQLYFGQAACHAGFRANLRVALEVMFRPSGGGRPAGIRVNATPPGFGGIPFPCP